jgi:hypothetical protein
LVRAAQSHEKAPSGATMSWQPAEAGRQDRGHVAGVGTVLGVVLGAVGVVPDEPPDPPEPPMFGQSALEPEPWLRGGVVVVPSDGVVLGAGEADGSGLAAETTATPPPTRSNAASAAVSTVRRTPFGFVPTSVVSAGAGV